MPISLDELRLILYIGGAETVEEMPVENGSALSGTSAMLDPLPPAPERDRNASLQASKMTAADLFKGIWVIEETPEEAVSDSGSSTDVRTLGRELPLPLLPLIPHTDTNHSLHSSIFLHSASRGLLTILQGQPSSYAPMVTCKISYSRITG